MEGGYPGILVIHGQHRLGHGVLIERGLVAFDGAHGNHVARALLRLLEAAGIARDHRDAAQHRLHDDEAEAFVPERRHHQDARLGEDVVDARSVGEDAYVGEARERGAVLGGGAPTGDGGEFAARHAGGGFEEDADAFHGAWVDHDDAAAVEVRVNRATGLGRRWADELRWGGGRGNARCIRPCDGRWRRCRRIVRRARPRRGRDSSSRGRTGRTAECARGKRRGRARCGGLHAAARG